MPSRGRKSRQPKLKTPGGEKLRALRQAAGLTLIELAAKLESDLGKPIDVGHINKIETGRIGKPLAETLAAILEGVQASYGERRAVLEAFGYSFSMTLPSPREVDEMRRLSEHELNDATYPILLIDFAHRLLAWNRYAPRLLGLHPDDPRMHAFYGVTTFDLAFNPDLGGQLLLENPDAFWSAWLYMVKSDLYAFRHEPWYAVLLANVRGLPGFSAVWDGLPEGPVRYVASRNIVPLQLRVPGSGILQFRLSSADFILDSRFRIIHFTPYGAVTLHEVARWAEEEGVL
jgi:transcriptional regulator with XRE-family HTH domain